jgi:hypothetical protein
MKARVAALLTFFILTGCSLEMRPGDYVKYFDKNRKKFSETVNQGGYSITVTYCPPELIAARVLANNGGFSLDTLLAGYRNSMIFSVVVKANDPSKSQSFVTGGYGQAGYSETIIKNTFKKDREIFLTNGPDTIPVVDYDYERNWGLGTGDAFTISFHAQAVGKRIKAYRLYLRNMSVEIGTIDIALKDIVRNNRKIALRGQT